MSRSHIVMGNLALAPAEGAQFSVISGRASRSSDAPSNVGLTYDGKPRALNLVILSLVVVTAIISMFFNLASADRAFSRALSETDLVSIEVDSGESLWQIAESHPIDGLTTDQTVEAMIRWNSIESSRLVPGQELLVART